jgi:hypothetical protein
MSVVTLWPDLSVSSLDVEAQGTQSDPTWQPTTGSPAGVFPRVLCTGSMGLTAPITPTNDEFSLYMVGTFAIGNMVNANPDAGGWGIGVNNDGLICAGVWATAFDQTWIVADDPIPDDSAQIVSLSFGKGSGHFNFAVNGDLVPAHFLFGGAPTASGFSDTTCNALFTISTYDALIGKSSNTPPPDQATTGGAAFNHLIMWDRYHTAPQRAQAVAYLTDKWAL